MSTTGTPSVIAMTTLQPASTASRMASAVNAGGTKIMAASTPSFSTASKTVSKTGTPKVVWPPFPGVTPATSLVPYSMQFLEWNSPTLPVMPWQTTLVFLLINMLIVWSGRINHGDTEDTEKKKNTNL